MWSPGSIADTSEGKSISMVHGDDDGHDEGENKENILVPAIPNLTDDLAVEVLSRLPSETLFWCRLVCKTWLSLFSNPTFIKIHRNRVEEKETLIIHTVDATTSYHQTSLLHIRNPKTTFNLDHPFHRYGMDLVGSINGLVCLSCTPWAEAIAIWNPLTNYYKYLPCPILKDKNGKLLVGFFFDSQTNDYKVVRTLRAERLGVVARQTEIFSLNSGTWTKTKCKLDFITISSKCDTIVNGEPYWWAFYSSPMFVVGLHGGGRIYRKVPKLRLPFKYRQECDRYRLVNYKNSLGVLIDCELTLSSLLCECLGLGSSNCEHAERTIILLVLDGTEKSWRVELRIGFPQEIERVIGCSTSGRLVLEDKSGTIVLLDTKNEDVEKVVIAGAMAGSFEISNYTASSVPIKGSEQVTGQENADAYLRHCKNVTNSLRKRPRVPLSTDKKGRIRWIDKHDGLIPGSSIWDD